MNQVSLSSLYYRAISAVVSVLHSPRSVENISSCIASIRRHLSSSRNKLYTAHLKRIFPNRNANWYKDVIRINWKVHERNLFSPLYMMKHKPSDVLVNVKWTGRQKLDRAVTRGKGVLLLAPHFGDERSLHILLGMAGYDIHVMTSRYLDLPAFAAESRLAPGRKWNTLHFPDENPRWMYRTLQQNGIIHYASTAYGGSGGTWITNFGLPVLVPSAPWKLQKRTGCSVLLASCAHLPGMGFHLDFREINLPEEGRGFASAVGSITEELAAEHPGQYEWKNLAIRHRETNTIVRLGEIPSDERILEQKAIPQDSDPSFTHPEAAY